MIVSVCLDRGWRTKYYVAALDWTGGGRSMRGVWGCRAVAVRFGAGGSSLREVDLLE